MGHLWSTLPLAQVLSLQLQQQPLVQMLSPLLLLLQMPLAQVLSVPQLQEPLAEVLPLPPLEGHLLQVLLPKGSLAQALLPPAQLLRLAWLTLPQVQASTSRPP